MAVPEIQRLRRFNRVVTQRIGVLDDSYLKLGRPLGEARLLFEIGPEGADVQVLRRRLGLDSGYLSRLLAALQRQGLIKVQNSRDDRRRRRAVLTGIGRSAKAEYDRISDAFAGVVLAPLNPGQRLRLLAAAEEVERLMSAHAVQIAPAAADEPALARCVASYFAELSQRFEGGFDAAKYLARAPDGDFLPPRGQTLIARLDDEPVGCASLKRLDANTGEIKRVWVDPALRGAGLARRLMCELEGHAAAAGFSRLRLGTNRALGEAQAMYAALGYVEVAPFDDDPFTHVWFEKTGPFGGAAGREGAGTPRIA
jgi:DNA-binding MarR family transcriptional regulator/ribosomal protein S18 acetylase RimI-like enzyme